MVKAFHDLGPDEGEDVPENCIECGDLCEDPEEDGYCTECFLVVTVGAI